MMRANLSNLFYNTAIVKIGPVKTAIFFNLSIVFSSVMGMVFLNESLFWYHFIGILFIVLGVWMVNRYVAKKETIAEAKAVG